MARTKSQRRDRFAHHSVPEAIAQGRLAPRKGPPCSKCGQHHLRCNGHKTFWSEPDSNGVRTKLGIRPCWKWPSRGQTVCSKHGGGEAAGVRKQEGLKRWHTEREQNKQMAKLARAARTLGLPLEVDPQQALLQEIYRTAGAVAWLGERVGDLPESALSWNLVSEERKQGTEGFAGEDGEGGEVDLTTTIHGAKPAVLLELYHRERNHLVHVCKVAITCGIAERQIRIAEEQGQQIAQTLRTTFEDPELGLTEVQLEVARLLAAKVLHQLSLAVNVRPALAVVKQLPRPAGDGDGD